MLFSSHKPINYMYCNVKRHGRFYKCSYRPAVPLGLMVREVQERIGERWLLDVGGERTQVAVCGERSAASSKVPSIHRYIHSNLCIYVYRKDSGRIAGRTHLSQVVTRGASLEDVSLRRRENRIYIMSLQYIKPFENK